MPYFFDVAGVPATTWTSGVDRPHLRSQAHQSIRTSAAYPVGRLSTSTVAPIADDIATPRTLTRAAKNCARERPDFAMATAMAGSRYIIMGYGYDITSTDVHAYSALLQAAAVADVEEATMKADVRTLHEG